MIIYSSSRSKYTLFSLLVAYYTSNMIQVVLSEFDTNFTALCQQGIKQGLEDFQRLREADKRYQTQLANVTNNAFEKASIDQNAVNSSDSDLREVHFPSRPCRTSGADMEHYTGHPIPRDIYSTRWRVGAIPYQTNR